MLWSSGGPGQEGKNVNVLRQTLGSLSGEEHLCRYEQGSPLNSVPLIHPGVPLSFPGATPAGVTVPGLTLLDLCKLLHSWEQSCSLLTTAEENKSFQGLEDNELPISPTPILTSPTPFPLTSGKSPRSFSHHGAVIYLFIS